MPALPIGVTYVDIDAGYNQSLARLSDGRVVAWGNNDYGQCDVPALHSGLTFTEIAASMYSTMALYSSLPACGSTALYCSPGGANSVSTSGASLEASGCPRISPDDLVLAVSGLPPEGLGVFFYGQEQTHLPFGNGWRCIGGSVRRVLPMLVADATGVVTLPLDLLSHPFTGSSHSITPGSAWNFQFGYRDPAGSPTEFNVSDAQHIVFAL